MRTVFTLINIPDSISISLKFLFNIVIPKKLGYSSIVEEYLRDSVADYIYLGKLLHIPVKVFSIMMNYFLRLSKHGGPLTVIFLDADIKVLKNRWFVCKTPEERLDYIIMQKNTLLFLS